MTFVDNVRGGKGANVEAVLEASAECISYDSEASKMKCYLHLVSNLLSKDVQFPLKFPLVKIAVLAVLSGAVVLLKNDERLENFGFFAFRGRTKDGVVGGDLSPTKNS